MDKKHLYMAHTSIKVQNSCICVDLILMKNGIYILILIAFSAKYTQMGKNPISGKRNIKKGKLKSPKCAC